MNLREIIETALKEGIIEIFGGGTSDTYASPDGYGLRGGGEWEAGCRPTNACDIPQARSLTDVVRVSQGLISREVAWELAIGSETPAREAGLAEALFACQRHLSLAGERELALWLRFSRHNFRYYSPEKRRKTLALLETELGANGAKFPSMCAKVRAHVDQELRDLDASEAREAAEKAAEKAEQALDGLSDDAEQAVRCTLAYARPEYRKMTPKDIGGPLSEYAQHPEAAKIMAAVARRSGLSEQDIFAATMAAL